MNRKEFDSLEIIDQISYVNKLLMEGNSLRSISTNLGISKTTIRDRFYKIGHVFDAETKQYIRIYKKTIFEIVDDKKSNTSVTRDIFSEPVKKPAKKVVKRNTKEIQKNNNADLKVIDEGNTKEILRYKNDLLDLINCKNDILEMLKDYKSNTKIIEVPQLDINSLPDDIQDKIISKSMKVYAEAYKLFDMLCSQYPNYKKQDLISLALYEFYNKYKK